MAPIRWGALVAAVLMTAACGSTARMGEGRVSAGSDEFSLEPSESGGPTPTSVSEGLGEGPTSDAGGVGALGGGPAGGPGGVGPQGGPGGGGGGGATPVGRIPARHPAATDKTITIGFVYLAGAESFGRSLGTNVSSGDTKRQIEAVRDAVNAAGGIAGRQIRLLTYGFRAGQPISPQLQAACEYFTSDNKTLAVSMNQSLYDPLYDCLGQRDAAFVQSAGYADTTLYNRFPHHLFQPDGIRAERQLAASVDALAAAGWFGPNPVIGLSTLEGSYWDRLTKQVLAPRLAAHGWSIKTTFKYKIGASGPEGVGDYGPAAAQFKFDGVTHVLSLGNPPTMFMIAAESADFRPKWAVDTPSFAQNIEGNPSVARRQLIGAMGIGWLPASDVSAANRELVSPEDKRCEDIMKAVGEPTSAAVARYNQGTACSFVFFLKRALEAAPEISTRGLAAGAAALGDSHVSPFTWRVRFGPGRPDGVAAYRLLGWVESCSCFRYVSELRGLS